MRRSARHASSILACVLLLAAACTSGGGNKSASTRPLQFRRGGTLHVGVQQWNKDSPFDPTTEFGQSALWQCCMLRTLYSYNGHPTAQGGSDLQPDLAAGPGEVSADGLTWTFHIKPGLHYAPPLQSVEITARDFIRAIERVLTPAPKAVQPWTGQLLGGSLANYFLPVIEGAQDFSSGKANSISGLEALDPHTLRVHLTQAIGDLNYRLSLIPTAPIPPNPFHPDARFGVADGHNADGYARVLVSSGPYMYEGSDAVDFSKPPDQQQPASGFATLSLVRNPSWKSSSDSLRTAYVDRIQFSIFDSKPHSIEEGASPDPAEVRAYRTDFAAKVDAGEIDVVFDYPAPSEQVQRYQADQSLRSRLQTNEFGDVRFLSMNLALPPFDDIHVRRAVNYVIDKQRIFQLWQKSLNSAAIYDHLAPDAQEQNLLSNYTPYRSTNHGGDPAAARREMALSAYDQNHDGKCDQPACHISVQWRDNGAYPQMAEVVKANLAEIGIVLDVKLGPGFEMYQKCGDPAAHATLCQVGWGGDYPSASTYFPPLYSAGSLVGGLNASLTGASVEQLTKWHYPVKSVPNLDPRMNDCSVRLGVDQVQCWAGFDQYLMEQVVPAVPLLTDTAPWTFSAKVASFSWDQVTGAPALDQIALRPGT